MSENNWTLGDSVPDPEGWITTNSRPNLPDDTPIEYRGETSVSLGTVEEFTWSGEIKYRIVPESDFGPWESHDDGDSDPRSIVHVRLENGESKFDDSEAMYWDSSDCDEGEVVISYRRYKPQVQLEEGWVAWHGKTPAAPVHGDCLIKFKRRDGRDVEPMRACQLTWQHGAEGYDILAYKVEKWVVDPEQEFKHFGHEMRPVPPRTIVQIDQGYGYKQCGICPAESYGWEPVKTYRIVEGDS